MQHGLQQSRKYLFREEKAEITMRIVKRIMGKTIGYYSRRIINAPEKVINRVP